MNWTLVSLEQATPQSWRNGGGVTRELLAWPAADWRVRMSIADVQAAGPFSRFEGIERWFAVLEGQGVVLRLAEESHRLVAHSAPFRFDGAAAVDCALIGGATRDFNLMAPPGAARMERVRGRRQFACTRASLVAVYTHTAPSQVVIGVTTFAVPAFHLAWSLVDDGVTGNVRGEDALWMEVLQ
jgi:environmental stress-induced protein Ves